MGLYEERNGVSVALYTRTRGVAVLLCIPRVDARAESLLSGCCSLCGCGGKEGRRRGKERKRDKERRRRGFMCWSRRHRRRLARRATPHRHRRAPTTPLFRSRPRPGVHPQPGVCRLRARSGSALSSAPPRVLGLLVLSQSSSPQCSTPMLAARPYPTLNSVESLEPLKPHPRRRP